MCAGLLISIPVWLIIYAAEYDWLPHKIVAVSIAFIFIAGVTWLYDELHGY
jgi:hypothetical protein